ncbi:DUF3320 domain-containing protein [Niabella yanshanensis]|uniref:DUF3320 domain-containing protein n=1 Tax=Niabella yanshanensis TaxID=577386 RepID=A0ABZ0W4P6_9BACT|nr:DUF3320 domain-containing protein [Niabella yanshanensis]WQD37061.1 DUF3320 domain-containing protein [Niabella yanshanensis]
MINSNTIQLHKEIFPFLNISLYLNNIPLIRELTISNKGAGDYFGLELELKSDIPCIETFRYLIAQAPAGKEIRIPVDALKINRDYISQLSETEKAVLTINVKQQDEILISDTLTIDVHPLEYFGGFQVLPELIAAYVTPNHPYVYHIKRKAVEVLDRLRLKAAFDGYQQNSPETVMQTMSAIYTAIQSEEIVYSSLPPGYEATGQRLRLLNTLQQEKFGNCIDISLLFAACLEAADLNPLLIITHGHAFVGCWLHDDKFAEVINDDKAAITKRLSKGIRELAAVEATSVCKGNKTSFLEALNMGEAQLVEKEDFILSVDIRRARTARIRPLPLLHQGTTTKLDEAAMEQERAVSLQHSFDLGAIYQDELVSGAKATTKQKLWERKLLDLSLRNNLLNLRMTRNMLQLVDIDISHLEDTLSDGKSFSILPHATAEPLRRYNLFTQPLHHSSPLYQMANEELKYNRLLTHYHQQDLENILAYMHKSAKQAIEENGSSTLFLAVGLLKWYDGKTPEHPRFAPILLLPVELSRRSVNSRFNLKSREEDTMINMTLLEFLRQEYQLNLSGLEQLPYDEKGVDVAKVMGILRRAIMQLKGWDVEEQLVLGNFSFSKLILWKDIVQHQEALLKSDMVRSLVEGRLVSGDMEANIGNADFDAVASASLALPIATDVSQMEAVITAQKGQSYILHGPPGTGKSQTITNIIADALYRGKRVLFVAAKKAALDVVHKRLEQIGLAPFSLELHSNKSKKSDVLAQLAATLETTRNGVVADFEQEAKRLDQVKEQISQYVNLLHQKQPWGWSLYEGITALEAYRDRPTQPKPLPEQVLQELDTQRWQQWQDWLPGFQSIAQMIIHPAENPLAALQLQGYTAALQDEIEASIKKITGLLPAYQQSVQSVASALQFPFTLSNKNTQQQFVTAVEGLSRLPDMPLPLAVYLADRENYNTYEDWKRHFQQHQALLKAITANYNLNVLSADVAGIEMAWKQAEQSWFLPKWWNKRKLKKQLSLYKHQAIENNDEIVQLFQQHRQLKEEETILQQQRYQAVQQALKNLYKDEQTNITDIDDKASKIQQLSVLLQPFGRAAFLQWLSQLQQQSLVYTDDIKGIQPALQRELQPKAMQTSEAIGQFEALTGIVLPTGDGWTQAGLEQVGVLQSHLPHLKNWMNYVQQSNMGKRLQLDWLITAFESKDCTAADITTYCHYAVHRATVQKVIGQHEALSLFNAGMFETKIEQYKKIAKEFQQLTIQTLRNKLAAQLPNAGVEALQSSEPGILQRAIRSRGRGISIRRLFDQLPTLLPRMAPCMLMSPISAAQYFDVDANHFDLVIFDEASQLPTCEAVSALARAKQAVIVGDPKQMPPTAFFTSQKTDEEDVEIEDLESILDDCLSLSVPSKYLLRHYRSKHESLIAFSNANYYENKLLTFPSADDLNRKVQYHHVPGFYDKGKTRTNSFEADAIVQYIQQHYTDPKRSIRSLGVVTFSQTQQSLVEDKLQALFMKDAALEQLANEAAEPLFTKNLENVQGDERDIILFSVGYAPDEQGKMFMNFGPLNRNGGWRRLNVAVTRARYEMHVFATLSADQVDLSRTSAEGVAGLKAFLQFAQHGQLALRAQDVQREQAGLARTIAQRLQEKGLQVRCDIGTSGFKVDIGIVHPGKTQQYLLGILIDGDYYYNARTANDRERVMPSVLQALGWNLHRVWTMDWYENSDKVIDAIVQKSELILQQPGIVEEQLEKKITAATPIVQQVEAASSKTLPDTASKRRAYQPQSLPQEPHASSETIYKPDNRSRVQQQIKILLDAEAPISKSLLYKKILQAWNTTRAGARLEAYLQELISEMAITATLHHQPFYWSHTDRTIDYYRDNSIEKRSIEDIAPEEIVVAIQEAVVHNLSIEEEELIRYLCRVFGFAKVGKQIDSLLRYAIDEAERGGVVKREGGRVKIG